MHNHYRGGDPVTTSTRAIVSIFILLSVVIAGCMSVPVTFKTMTGRQYDADKSRTIKADACGLQLLLIIPINARDRTKRAYDSLMVQAGNDYVTNIKEQETWYYALVGTVYCTELEATAYPRISASEGFIARSKSVAGQ